MFYSNATTAVEPWFAFILDIFKWKKLYIFIKLKETEDYAMKAKHFKTYLELLYEEKLIEKSALNIKIIEVL